MPLVTLKWEILNQKFYAMCSWWKKDSVKSVMFLVSSLRLVLATACTLV